MCMPKTVFYDSELLNGIALAQSPCLQIVTQNNLIRANKRTVPEDYKVVVFPFVYKGVIGCT